jgi:hypothetical protein
LPPALLAVLTLLRIAVINVLAAAAAGVNVCLCTRIVRL